MAKKKEKSTFIMSLGHLLAVACIVLVFVFGTLPYISVSENAGSSFYDILKSGDVWFSGGLAIVIILGIVGLLTLGAALAGLLDKKRKSSLYCYILGGLLIVVAVLIFSGYEMYYAQIEEEAGIFGSIFSIGKEFTDPGTGYYLMGITACVGAGIEIVTGFLG